MSLIFTCIHINGCFHGDFKPSNLMVNEINSKLFYFLTDFSESKLLGPEMPIHY